MFSMTRILCICGIRRRGKGMMLENTAFRWLCSLVPSWERLRSFLLMSLFVLIPIYFIIMDIIQFTEMQSVSLTQQQPCSHGQACPNYAPWRPMTCKSLMMDPPYQYIIMPALDFLEMTTDFTGFLALFMTPSCISVASVLACALAGYYLSGGDPGRRKVAALLFLLRQVLDGMDGMLYRRQKGSPRLYISNPGQSWGSVVDIVCDVLGGILFFVGLLIYMLRRVEQSSSTLPVAEPCTRGLTKRRATLVVFSYGILIFVASTCWLIILNDFTLLFEKPLPTPELEKVQTAYLHSAGTVFVMYLWRLLQGHMLIHVIIIATVLNKVWEYISSVHLFIWGFVLTHLVISKVYATLVYNQLHP